MKLARISLTMTLVLGLGTSLGLAQASTPRNIIYLIGDGMGPAYTTAYRYYRDDPSTKAVENTIFDQLLVGLSSTYPDDDTYVTDSAAAATALATGHKSYNGAIAVDHQHSPLVTMMDQANEAGYNTGVVVTSQVNHATPASFLAHNKSRRNYNQIADNYADNLLKGLGSADILLGGGTEYFQRQDRNLVEEFINYGYQYVDDLNQLTQLTELPALGLFAPSGLPPALGSTNPKRLQMMTDKALNLLDKQPQPFVLMVEASQIDWCGHSNDIACAMAEMHDFALALASAKAYVDKHPDTLLVATADHSTGGLTLGRKGDYQWRGKQLQQISTLPKAYAKILLENPNTLRNIKQFSASWVKHINLSLSDNQLAILQQTLLDASQSKTAVKKMASAIKRRIDALSYTGWTTTGHDGIDVPILAYGTGANQFAGHLDNTEIANKIINFIVK
ncbi:alkaline phosphatase [Shewanella sp. Scap07]|uniref:alkaline phosphatase n=1 Tax=Shewanella sp. Scap07 TaxID=2589987 RepID=UPI0015B95F24|nr:alkaline phosphatase [Shewanella sp. Scap07]QLE84552.1 alkaline phosphatase [Shewanella sp. Scap07]